MLTHITEPTASELSAIDRDANGPGRLARSWTQMTRLVRERLLDPAAPRQVRARARIYRDGHHFLGLAISAHGDLSIEFGALDRAGQRVTTGRLHARWDALGLTGPYRIAVRGREHTLNTFCVVLERYLALPELA
ncbi:MAG: hypothetical protein LCH70_13265 [Proteobacteria bacterium]|nr:hypothetical protein [Pseudomonadota bacterium]